MGKNIHNNLNVLLDFFKERKINENNIMECKWLASLL